MHVQLVAFDLDDTLYLERDFVKSGFVAVGQYLHNSGIIEGEIFSRTAWRLFENGVRGTIINQTLEILGNYYTSELIQRLVAIYREHQPDIRPFANSKRLLEDLIKRDKITALITDGSLQTQKNKLCALGLSDLFQQVIFTEALGQDGAKPSPRGFLEVSRQQRVENRKCVYIADNPLKDFLGPNLLGWRTIRLREMGGIYYHEIPPAGGEPHVTVERFADLWNLLRDWVDL